MRASERPAPASGDLWDAYALYVRLGEALHGQSPISPSKIDAVDLRRTPTTDPTRPWVTERQELLFIGEEIAPEQRRAAEVVERLWRSLYHDEVRGYLVEVRKYDFGLVQLAPPSPSFVQPSWWAVGPTNINLVLCACAGNIRLPDGRKATLQVARIDAEQLCESPVEREEARLIAESGAAQSHEGFTLAQWCGLRRWKLATEAIPLLLGARPDLRDSHITKPWDASPPRYSPWHSGLGAAADKGRERRKIPPSSDSKLDLMDRHVEDGVLVVEIETMPDLFKRTERTIRARYVEPRGIVRWWVAQGFDLPADLHHEAEHRGWIGAPQNAVQAIVGAFRDAFDTTSEPLPAQPQPPAGLFLEGKPESALYFECPECSAPVGASCRIDHARWRYDPRDSGSAVMSPWMHVRRRSQRFPEPEDALRLGEMIVAGDVELPLEGLDALVRKQWEGGWDRVHELVSLRESLRARAGEPGDPAMRLLRRLDQILSSPTRSDVAPASRLERVVAGAQLRRCIPQRSWIGGDWRDLDPLLPEGVTSEGDGKGGLRFTGFGDQPLLSKRIAEKNGRIRKAVEAVLAEISPD